MGQRKMETEVQRGNRTAIAIAIGAALCLVALFFVEHQQCPYTVKDVVAQWDHCAREPQEDDQ